MPRHLEMVWTKCQPKSWSGQNANHEKKSRTKCQPRLAFCPVGILSGWHFVLPPTQLHWKISSLVAILKKEMLKKCGNPNYSCFELWWNHFGGPHKPPVLKPTFHDQHVNRIWLFHFTFLNKCFFTIKQVFYVPLPLTCPWLCLHSWWFESGNQHCNIALQIKVFQQTWYCGFSSNWILHYFPSVRACVRHRRDISHFSHI